MADGITKTVLADVQTLWDYHQLGHELRPCDVAIGLGSHDIGVADRAAEVFHERLVPLLLFSGANAPTTIDVFPRGEAVHYRERAVAFGVPDDAILIEPRATNTGENVILSRQLLTEYGIEPQSVLLVTRPYQQRRAYATARLQWPHVAILCTAQTILLTNYLKGIGDPRFVIDMIVGDTYRVIEHPKLGFAIPQPMPSDVLASYQRLVAAGFTNRLP